MKLCLFLYCLTACLSVLSPVFGQTAGGAVAGHAAASALPPGFAAFYIGRWAGTGAFANGTKISAHVSFRWSLDSAWVIYEHQDDPPGRYKALSMWGRDKQSGAPVEMIFDNFQGHRIFVSNGPDTAGRLIWNTREPGPAGKGWVFERFRYEQLNAGQFKMTYEMSRDGLSWQTGDWLIFAREPGAPE